ncbi:MAG: FAD-dependent oxidoreductase [Acetatifactor sp.]
MESLWMEEVHIPRRRAAEGLYQRDVVVIGAGMAGILTAWKLQQAGLKVTVLEADRIAGGQTGRTTAKITSQHGLIYSRLVEEIGWQKAKLYADANQRAIDEFENLIRNQKIDCDFERVPAYLYSRKESGQLLDEARVAAELGISAYFTDSPELPFQTAGAVCFENQACFHPLKFIRSLAEQLEIFEQSPVTVVRGGMVGTERARFLANQVIFATHYPFRNVPGFYFLRQHQERSYVIALERKQASEAQDGAGYANRFAEGSKWPEGMYLCAESDGLSLRSTGDILLLGGNSHRTGKNRQGGAYGSLKAAACKYFPEGRVVAEWSAQDCMPHDGVPFIGRYSVWKSNWYVATGFGKWGMTSSMVTALLLTDMLQGKKNSWEKVFTPQRLRPQSGMANFFSDLAESAAGLTKGFFVPWEGQTCARCTHMGCKLTWNPDDNSWDCPCHGSRFDADGKLREDPAQRDMDR